MINDLSIYKGKIIIVKNNLFSTYYPIDIPSTTAASSQIYENEDSTDETSNIQKFYSDFKSIDGVSFYSYVNRHFEIDTKTNIIEYNFYNNNSEHTNIPENISIQNIEFSKFELLKNNLQRAKLSPNLYVIECFDDQPVDEIAILNSIGNNIGIFFKRGNVSNRIKNTKSQKHLSLFKKYWGDNADFRELRIYNDPDINNETTEISQGSLISDVINQCELAIQNKDSNYSDIIITAPTGSGKSLLFQIPAIYLHENAIKRLTIVICPLVALMYDQVKELQDRGIGFATYINSEITFEERQDRIEGIIEGRYTLIYLSPELLLSTDIKNIIGDQKIGLMVIDEAHLVTSWGRDFRVDYWFLGDYLEKLRRGNYSNKNADAMNFPILCLTATAVYGGRDDVIKDLSKSLHLNCSSDHLYIGYLMRNNITFEINCPSQRVKISSKEEKLTLTTERIKSFIDKKEKSIVYFPYVSQIEDAVNEISSKYPANKTYVEKYSGSKMKSLEKNDSYLRFKSSEALIMLATKAFGMGVDIPDVVNVYHYAPTGTLADYVQEIGRAARKIEQGYAITDYLKNDMHFAKTLWGLSGLRHYQIKAMIKKLYDIYQNKKSRNLLISPDVFSYLFDANSIDMKVKSGLMLLSTDLLEKYHFRVINVRPKNIYSINYINVPSEVKDDFLFEYGAYCVKENDDKPRIIPAHGYQPLMTEYNSGDIFEINLGELWECKFNYLTYPKFKYHFFSGDLFIYGTSKITPRLKLVINYEKSYDYAKKRLFVIASALQKTFIKIHKVYGGKDFSFNEFVKAFNDNYGSKVRREYLRMLLETFCYEKTDVYDIPNEQWKFIERRANSEDGKLGETYFCIRTAKYGFIEQNIKRYLVQASPNTDSGNEFVTYLTIPRKNENYSEYQLMASLLEMFDLATYDYIGGRNPQIFVRINDPLKLKRIAESDKRYENLLLKDIEDRHERAAKIVDKFMTADLSNEDRWAVIENYFLGRDNLVDLKLGITS